MKQVLITASLLISSISFGQKSKAPIASKDIYNTIAGPSLVTSASLAEVADNFFISDGFGGYRLILDSAHSFVKESFSCMIRYMIDSGSWKVENEMLILKSPKGRQTFDVLRFDNYIILVNPSRRQSFVNDFVRLQKQYKHFTPVEFEGEEPWSKDRVIGYNLKNKYFIREICE
jgi:hypothetical protein